MTRSASQHSETDEPSGSGQAWRERISTAAYFRSERRDFAPGFELEDWFEAERSLEPETRRQG
jgi:hypothetical protein